MKKILAVLAVLCSLSAYSQQEYTYENKGINIFLESEGGCSRQFAIGGVNFIIGYQFNPHVFVGGGAAMKYGGSRYFNREVKEDWGWYDEATKTYHSDYYIDEKGYYHEYQSSCRYDDCCCDDGFFDMYMDFFVDFKYNFLAKTRYTPYLDFKSGFFCGSENTSTFDDLAVGCRFGCGEGDFAITAGAGYSFRRMENDGYGNQHLFMLKLGVEF